MVTISFLQPLLMTPTPSAIKESASACTRTVQLRTRFLKNQMSMVSGHSEKSSIIQTGSLLKAFSREDRSEILKFGKIDPVMLDAEELVAMKAHLSLPWEKLKAMGR